MKIGILGAMDEEILLLSESLQDMQVIEKNHLTFYLGRLHNTDIVLVKCGIGKVAAAVATTLLVNHFTPDYVVNTGSAGGFDTDLDIGDVLIATEVVHHDADLTHFGYLLGQTAGMPATFTCDQTLVAAAQRAATKLTDVKYKHGLICTGDAFIGSDEAAAELRAKFPDIGAAEMEGAAIGNACHLLSVPFLVIRSLSDIAGKSSTVSFQSYLEQAAKHSAQLVMAMTLELSSQAAE